MKQNIVHIGLDVDDTQYHVSAFNKDTGEVVDFKSPPTLKGLLQQLDRMARHFKGQKIKMCYEASSVGYCLQRDLISNDIHCDIVSPSSIASPRGKAIKTDRGHQPHRIDEAPNAHALRDQEGNHEIGDGRYPVARP